MGEQENAQRVKEVEAISRKSDLFSSQIQRLRVLLLGLLAATYPGQELYAQNGREQAEKGSLASIRTRLREAREHFTFLGEPINPLAVHDLSPLLSDVLPGPVAIDLAGTYHSNRYFGVTKRARDGSVSMELSTTHGAADTGDANEGYVGYRRLGVLANGVQVLRIWSNGGGSGIFESLLLVRFGMDSEYREDGARRYRVLLLRVGGCGLGDRFAGSIKLFPRDNTIRIHGDGEKTTRMLHIR